MRQWCLLLSLLASMFPAIGEDASAMPSIFLVAKKDLPDPFFYDSVVLVTHRAGPVPMGVIINRPTPIPLSRAAPDFEKSPARDQRVFFGGPVSPEVLVVVFRDATRPTDAIEVLPGVYMSSSLEVLQEILGREKPVKDLRVFAGHAAWSRGQLEGEVARGGWHLAPADAAAIFDAKPEDLWRKLERRVSTKMLRHPDTCCPLRLEFAGERNP